MGEPSARKFVRTALAVGALLALIFGVAAWQEWAAIDQNVAALARERGVALFKLIELTRDWNAQHGGVYVKVTERTQPNPWLEHPQRDVVTGQGVLTMVNPAFMTRQLAELAERADGSRFHITSLRPIRPENGADAWERLALTDFEHGLAERLEFFDDPGRPSHRYMAPLVVKDACLKCHAKQNYVVGDIRGGISIEMPAGALLELRARQRWRTGLVFGVSATLVVALLAFVTARTLRHVGELGALAQAQERLVAERTESLSQANAQLREEVAQREARERRLLIAAAVMDNAAEGIMVTDADNRIIEVNAGFTAITGYRPAEVLGKPPSVLSSGRHGPDFYAALWASLARDGRWQGEIWNRRHTGEVYPQWLAIATIAGDASSGGRYVATFTDISQRKQAEEALRQLAHSDPLTGLANRSLFFDRLGMVFTQARRYEEQFALLYLDLDDFKRVNDTRGHAAGDLLLIEVARRLREVVRDSDTVARLGGDEFAIVLPKLAAPAAAEDVAARVVKALALPFAIDGQAVKVSVSVGVALYPVHAGDLDALKRREAPRAKRLPARARIVVADGQHRAASAFAIEVERAQCAAP